MTNELQTISEKCVGWIICPEGHVSSLNKLNSIPFQRVNVTTSKTVNYIGCVPISKHIWMKFYPRPPRDEKYCHGQHHLSNCRSIHLCTSLSTNLPFSHVTASQPTIFPVAPSYLVQSLTPPLTWILLILLRLHPFLHGLWLWNWILSVCCILRKAGSQSSILM